MAIALFVGLRTSSRVAMSSVPVPLIYCQPLPVGSTNFMLILRLWTGFEKYVSIRALPYGLCAA